jgi:uncharacterized protein YutE (UPF0331/DUF86 family)
MTRAGRARIDQRLERIERACAELERAAATDREAWSRDEDAVAAAERRLEVAIQAAIDVASHVVAQRGWKTPETYRDAFGELQHRGVLAAELAAKLQEAAGLRNVLGHDYLDVDPARLHADLAGDVAVLREFAKVVVASLG